MKRNRVASHFEMKKKTTGKNKVTKHFEREKRIEDVNGDISKIGFLNQRKIKYN